MSQVLNSWRCDRDPRPRTHCRELDVFNGSPTSVVTTINAADALLAAQAGRLPLSLAPSSAVRQQMLSLAAILDDYNNRKGVAGCKPE